MTAPKRGTVRGAPIVAAHNMQRATLNIRTKIRILKSWADDGIPLTNHHNEQSESDAVDLEYFPKSRRQFNHWDGSQNTGETKESLPGISTNANDTLRKHPDLCREVEDALEAVRLKAAEQTSSRKQESKAKLRLSLQRERTLRLSLERELISLRKGLKEVQALSRKHDEMHRGQVAELKSQLLDLSNKLEVLEGEKASLIRTLAKIKPIGSVSD